MQRRTFIRGLLFLSGGLSGYSLTKLARPKTKSPTSTETFIASIEAVNLHESSSKLLLKLIARQFTDQDRNTFIVEVANHNRNLFITDPDTKQHGTPGFYRVSG